MIDHDIRGTHPLYLLAGIAVLVLGALTYLPASLVLAALEALS